MLIGDEDNEDDEDEEDDGDDGDLQPPRILDEGDLKSTHSVAIGLPLPGNHSNTDNLCQIDAMIDAIP